MFFREGVPAGIERIIREQIERAIEELTGQTNNSQDEAVHEARKCFKKIRAVLRLVRDELPQAVYQRENLFKILLHYVVIHVFCQLES